MRAWWSDYGWYVIGGIALGAFILFGINYYQSKQVEDAVAGVTGIKHIVSNVVEGASTTTLEFELGVPVDRATSDVKNAIDQIRADLPNSIEEPIVQRIDIAGLPILSYGVTAPAMTPEENRRV